MLVHLLNCPVRAISSLASEVLLDLGPALIWLPLSFELGVKNLISSIPMIFQVDLIGDIEFGFLLVILCLEGIDRTILPSRVCQLHLVILRPNLNVLLVEI